MNLTRKHIYWGLGISAGLIGIGLFIRYHRRQVKQIAGNVQSWLRPVTAKITSGFGYRTDPKTGKAGAFHNGIDLAVPVGTAIKAPMDGVVSLVNSGGDGGNQIVIRHTNGYFTGYAHLSKQLVKKGDQVKKGEVIGLSGNTGKSTGPHLHFTMTDRSGAKVDPRKYMYA